MKIAIILIVILLLLLAGCNDEEVIDREEAYQKCVSICASVAGDDFTIIYICNENCKKEFLEDK